jgi:hypothetical protein
MTESRTPNCSAWPFRLALFAAILLVACGQRAEKTPNSLPASTSQQSGHSATSAMAPDTQSEALSAGEPEGEKLFSSPSGDANTLLIWQTLAFVLAIAAAIAILLVAWLYLWRRRLPDGQISVVPEQVLTTMAELAKLNAGQVQFAQTALSSLKSDYAEIRQGFSVFSASAAEKDAQIQRLRQGSDKQVFVQFLRRFIRVARLVESDLEEDRAQGKDTSAIESLHDHLLNALSDCGVETFAPSAGEDYRTRNDVADGPRTIGTDTSEQDWKIHRTLQAGFRLQTGGDPIVVERAVVEIFRLNT